MTSDLVSPTGVVFVSFHSEDLIVPLATALVAAGIPVAVADNSGTWPGCQGVVVVDPGRNVGFARGCNLAVARLPDHVDVVCLHNPDVLATPDQVERLAGAVRAQSVPGMCSAALRIGTQVRRRGYRYPGPLRELGVAARAVRRARRPTQPPQPTGSRSLHRTVERASGRRFGSGGCIAISRSAFEALKGFDERYFLYAEDLDLWHRAAAAGFEVGFAEEIVVEHLDAQGSPMAAGRRELLRRLGVELFVESHGPAGSWRWYRSIHRLMSSSVRGVWPELSEHVVQLWGAGQSPSEIASAVRPMLERRDEVAPGPEDPSLGGVDVVFAHRWYWPSVGGVERQMTYLTEVVRQAGGRLQVMTTTPQPEVPAWVRATSAGRAGRWMPAYAAWLAVQLLRARIRAGRRPLVVLVGSLSAEAAVMSLLAGPLRLRYVVYLAGGDAQGSEFSAQRRGWLRSRTLATASAFVVHVASYGEEVRAAGFRGSIDVLPTMVPEVEVLPCATQLHPPEGALSAVWCGRVHPVKDLAALSRLAGGAFRDHSIHLTLIADRVPDEDFAGSTIHVSCPSPRSHLRSADVLVLTSEHEVQPNVMAEAAMEGVPLMAYGVGGLDEAVADLRHGRTLPRGTRDEDFASATADLAAAYASPDKRQDLRAAAHDRFARAGDLWLELLCRAGRG